MNFANNVCLDGDVVSFIWEIENYDFYQCERGECLKSSEFTVQNRKPMHLEFYPKADVFEKDGNYSVYLSGIVKRGNDIIDCFLDSSSMSNVSFELISGKPPRWNFKKVVSKNPSSTPIDNDECFFKNETLIIKCKFQFNRDMKEVSNDNESKNDIEALAYDIEKMCLNSQMSDFTLIYNETKLHLHKAILHARVPKLASNLNVEKCSETNIEENFFNPKVSLETLKSFMFYVYSGKIPALSTEKIKGLYYLGHRFEVDSLKKKFCCHPEESICRTRVKRDAKSFTWKIEDFDNFLAGSESFGPSLGSGIIPNSDLNFVAKMELEQDVFDLRITINRICLEPKNPIYVSCRISVLIFTGESKYIYNGGHLFVSDIPWKLPTFFRIMKTTTDREMYRLMNGSILCMKGKAFQLSVSLLISGKEVDTNIISTGSALTSEAISAQSSHDTRSLSKDLGKLYNIFLPKASDVLLKTGALKFPAHKVILSARSLVFCRMFENEMLEKETETVDISDIDVGTLNLMFTYVYSGKLDTSLNFENLLSLYAAADKYDITSLRERCTVILKNKMNEENVCDLLVTADMHSDVHLKNCAKEYICEKSDVILSQAKWKEFMNARNDLASEIFQMLMSCILSHKRSCVQCSKHKLVK